MAQNPAAVCGRRQGRQRGRSSRLKDVTTKADEADQGKPIQPTLFNDQAGRVELGQAAVVAGDGSPRPNRHASPRVPRADVRAIQDLIWKEALLAVRAVEQFDTDPAFQDHLRQTLPQNSLETRERYAQTLVRW